MAQRYHRYRVGRRWLVVLGVVGCVLFHLFIVARVFLSPEQFRIRTQLILQRVSPGALVVGSAGYRFPSEFRIDGIELSRSEELGGTKLFGCEALRIHFSWLALLRGKMSLDELIIERPELELTRDDLVSMKKPSEEPTKAQVEQILIRDGRIHLGKGVLFLLDNDDGKVESPEQELRSIDVELVRERHRANSYAFSGSTDSDLWGRCDLSGVADLKRRVLDVNLVARRIAIDEKVRALLPSRTVRALDRFGVQGTVDLIVQASVAWGKEAKGAPLRTVKATVELRDCTAAWEKIPIPVTGIRGRLVFDGKNIYYRDIMGRAGEADLALKGTATGERVEMTVTVRGRAMDGELHDNLYDKLQKVWDRCGVRSGTLDVDYRSTWVRADRSLEISAVSHIRDVEAVYSTFPYPLTDVAGTLRWEGSGPEKKVRGASHIDRLVGRHGSARVEVSGQVADNGVPQLVIKADDLPFDKALRDAMPAGWQKTFDELRPEGSGSVECRITSPTEDPKKLAYRVVIRPEGASFQYKTFRHRITDVRGEIRVDEKGAVTFHNLKGRLGALTLQFLGGVRVGKEKPAPDITVVAPEVDLSPTVRDLLGKGWQTVYDQLSPQGKVAVSWKFGTAPETGEPRQSTEVRCIQDCSIEHERFPVRVTGLIGRVYVDETGRTTFSEMRGHIGNASIEAIDGVFAPGPKGGIRLTLKATGLSFAEAIYKALPEAHRKVWDSFQPEGTASVLYTYNHPTGSEKGTSTISIEPSDASFTFKQFALPVTDIIRGKIAIDQDGNVTASNILGKVKGKTVQLSGKMVGAEEGAKAQLDVEISELALDRELRAVLPKTLQATWDRFEPKGVVSATASLLIALPSGKFERFQLKAALKGVQARYDKLPVPLTELRGEVEYHDGMVRLTNVEGQSPLAEQVGLDGRYHEGKGSRIRVRAQGVKIVADLVKHLPKDVAKAVDDLELKGCADVDLTVSDEARDSTTAAGMINLHDCSFKQKYQFANLVGTVNIDKGELAADGSRLFEGRLNLQRLVAKGFEFSDVTGGFAYEKQKGKGATLSLRNLGGGFHGGRVSAKLDVELETKAAPRLWLALSAVDFKQLCKETLGAEKPGSGALSMRVDFPPEREHKGEGVIGDGQALVQDGELGELPLSTSLFNVIGFKSPLERSVTRADVKFAVAEDHLVIDQLTLSGETQLMTGWGTVGFDNKLDLTFYTPKKGTILTDIIRVLPDNLLEVKVEGTVGKPVTRVNAVPVIPRALKAFNSVFAFWRESRSDKPER